jgi:hypothetical protein
MGLGQFLFVLLCIYVVGWIVGWGTSNPAPVVRPVFILAPPFAINVPLSCNGQMQCSFTVSMGSAPARLDVVQQIEEGDPKAAPDFRTPAN